MIFTVTSSGNFQVHESIKTTFYNKSETAKKKIKPYRELDYRMVVFSNIKLGLNSKSRDK